jgi:glutathione S-transferase
VQLSLCIFSVASQLPYYVDGDVKLTQSNAILRYIAGKHNLIGTNEKEKIRVDLMENEIGDFRMDGSDCATVLILYDNFKV